MEEFDEKINLLNKVKCLNNELILKNGNIVFNTSIFHKIDKKTEQLLSNLLNYNNIDKIIFKYLGEKRKYKMIDFYDELNVFEKRKYEGACKSLEKQLMNFDDDMVDILNKWFEIYENQLNLNSMFEEKSQVDKQIECDDWYIPDEECEKDEEKTRRY